MSKSTPGQQRYATAEFKGRCLELMDRVRETGEELVVTKHGKPIRSTASATSTGIVEAGNGRESATRQVVFTVTR